MKRDFFLRWGNKGGSFSTKLLLICGYFEQSLVWENEKVPNVDLYSGQIIAIIDRGRI